MTAYRAFGKRSLDIAMSSIGLLALWPLLLAIAAVLRIKMGSPVLFRQQRVGRQGRIFTLLKFRTMRLDSESMGTVTVQGDPRVTPFGAVLRRIKMDEFPQLMNVLVGDMSLVGPRPDVPELIDTLTSADRAVLSERPGVTGPASVIYAREEAILARKRNPIIYNEKVIFLRKVRINKLYISNMSLCADLYWIIRTISCLWPRREET